MLIVAEKLHHLRYERPACRKLLPFLHVLEPERQACQISITTNRRSTATTVPQMYKAARPTNVARAASVTFRSKSRADCDGKGVYLEVGAARLIIVDFSFVLRRNRRAFADFLLQANAPV